MKKYILPAMLTLAASAFAQTTPNTMYINLKDGSKVEYTITDIDNITFEEKQDVTPEEPGAVKFAIPASFSSSYVQKVMSAGKQVAEIDLEYINSTKQQLVVVYPCDENGKAILTKGMTADGASVVWDVDKNTATVGEAADAITDFYIVDGELLTSYAGETADALVQPDLLVDVRGKESNTYRIVKIGTQYWMADNLRTTCYADGSAIDSYSETDTDGWKNNTTGAYLAYGDKEWIEYVGYLYSGYAVMNEKGLAPEGWEIPTQAQWTKVKTAGGSTMANFKDSAMMTWADGGEGTNINGFSGIATGYYSTATGLTALNTDAYFWSTTKYYDSLVRGDVIDYARLTAKGTNMVVSTTTTGGHSLAFGHSIRCVRK